ncbi:NUDIX domain-containing protein [Candidatus Kaiserbacteria bacterium]|nr:NUDIX domain-containing protein [Candidatus Kaiserbacteria bacterium]
MRIFRRVGMYISLSAIALVRIVRYALARLQRRGEVQGVRIIIVKDRLIVLVTHWYAPWVWTLPGGGVEREESPEQAAVREGKEETGLAIKTLAGEIGTYTGSMGKRDKIRVYYTGDFDGNLTLLPNFEIMGRSWFDIDNLPDELSPANRRRVEAYRAGVRGETGHW